MCVLREGNRDAHGGLDYCLAAVSCKVFARPGVTKRQLPGYKSRMSRCTYCHSTDQQIKSGLNASGSQRFCCRRCDHIYTPAPSPNGYPDEVRRQAVKLYLEGINLRRIGRILSVVLVQIAEQRARVPHPAQSHPASTASHTCGTLSHSFSMTAGVSDCPFLIFRTNSITLIVTAALAKLLKPSIG